MTGPGWRPLLHLPADVVQQGLRIGVAGLDVQRVFQVILGRTPVADDGVDVAHALVGDEVVGENLQHAPVMLVGVAVVPGPDDQQVGQIGVGLQVVRLQGQGVAELVHRLLVALGDHEDVAQVDPGEDVVGLQLQGLAEPGLRLGGEVLGQVHVAEVGQGDGRVGGQGDGALQLRLRLLELPAHGQKRAQGGEGVGVVGPGVHGGDVELLGLRQVPVQLVDEPQVEVRLGGRRRLFALRPAGEVIHEQELGVLQQPVAEGGDGRGQRLVHLALGPEGGGGEQQ